MKWVKPGGLIFFEAYTKEDKKESQGKIQNKLYLLKASRSFDHVSWLESFKV